MRIVSVTHYYPSQQGGIEVVAFEINRRLAAAGHIVEWFASETSTLPKQVQGLHYRPVRASDLVERLFGLPLPLWISRGLLQLASAIRECDAVHVHDFIYPGSLFAILLGSIWRKPVILTQHIGHIPYQSAFLSGVLAGVNHTLGKIALGKVSQAVFISNSVETYFRSFVRFKRPPIYIPNGVDRSVFFPVSDTDRRQLKAQLGLSESPTFIFVGRFVEKKGLAMLAKLVRLTPEIQWLFAGDGPIDPDSWAADNVRAFRGLRGEHLARLYRAADLLLLPSRGEGFPLVVQEAFSCGTPAFVSDETAMGCAGARHLLFELPVTGDDAVNAWQERLCALCADFSTIAERRAAVAEFARKTWDWDAAVDKYTELYASGNPLA